MEEQRGIATLQLDKDLWYNIHVLVYDLCNIATDRAAESRTLATTDELYISAPYFTPEEATSIKTMQILQPSLSEMPEFEALDYEEPASEETSAKDCNSSSVFMTIEQAIKYCLRNFFEKRRASGDARPCGPHDLGPIYCAVFGIAKAELKDEKFLSRMRRSGLPRLDTHAEQNSDGSSKKKGGKKGKRQGRRPA